MKQEFRNQVREISALHAKFRAEENERPPEAILSDSVEHDAQIDELLYGDSGELKKIAAILKTMSDDDVIYLQALCWYGRGDSIGDGKTFQPFLDYAKGQFHVAFREGLLNMEFSEYLSIAFQRLGEKL